MLPPRSLPRRIPSLLRPLRPPSNHIRPCKPRPFTSNSQLLLVSLPVGRPQLPFLHSPSVHSQPPVSNRLLKAITLRHHVPRLISTERRKRITNGLKIGFSAYAILLLFYVVQQGIYQEKIERMFPTPPEWSFKSRWFLRSARALQEPERFGKLATSWPNVGSYYKELLERLENPEIDGRGLEEQTEGGILIDGLGKAGYDIEGMSEPWKRGYFEALMGAGETA